MPEPATEEGWEVAPWFVFVSVEWGLFGPGEVAVVPVGVAIAPAAAVEEVGHAATAGAVRVGEVGLVGCGG